MERFVKLPSLEAGPFTTPTNRMINFDIGEGHVIDMSKSFVQLTVSMDIATEFTAQNSQPANLCVVSKVNDKYNPMNLELVKNCYLNSGKKGQLENIRRVNILKKNLAELTKSTDEKLSLHNSFYDYSTFDTKKELSSFVEFHKTGTIPSSYRNVSLKIPMSDLFELGSEVLNTSTLGRLKCHLELDDLDAYKFKVLSLTQPSDTVGKNVAAQGSDKVVINKEYHSLEASPWFVGEKVKVLYTDGTQPQKNLVATIVAIAYNEVSKEISITLDQAIPASTSAPQVALTNVQIVEFTTTFAVDVPATLHVLTAEVCLAELDLMGVPQPNELQYMTYTTEELSVNNSWMSRIFEVEPEAVNAWLMFHREGTATKYVNNSVNQYLKSYRLRCNTVDVVDRDILTNKNYGVDAATVRVHDPLHYDLLRKTCINGGYAIKNIALSDVSKVEGTYNQLLNEPENNIMVVSCPLPLTQENKKVQINLTNEGTNNIETVLLYKQVLRTIKL